MSGAPPERGRFITLEGPEGSGKTTAAAPPGRSGFATDGVATVLTHEPGGTPLGEEVRRIVLHMRGMSDDLDPRADALLYAAARAQHVARVIRPALERGEWVVCARYLDSSLAYQGAGYGNDLDEMRRLQAFATYETPARPDAAARPAGRGRAASGPAAAPSGTASRTPRRPPSSSGYATPTSRLLPRSPTGSRSSMDPARSRRPIRRSVPWSSERFDL